MPAPYTLTLAPQIGVELDTIPTDQVKLTLLPVIQGVKGDKGDVVDLNAGTGITINYATATLAVDTSVIATKTYADTAANTALTSANTFTTSGLNTKADLVGGTVPANQLPSYVDDVLEYTDLASLPVTGESGKIYVTLNTNLTYRWSGSSYVEISASLALGETSSTAYRGDLGKAAYDHSQTTGNPHGTTAAQITGLAAVAISNNYNDLDNLPVGGGSSITFDESRWNFSDALYPAATGGFFGSALNSGTVLYGSSVAGAFGVATISTSASANSGGSLASNAVMFVQQGSMVRSVFLLPNSVASRVVRIGFLYGISNAGETYGAYVNILNQTATANTSNSTATVQGSAVLPLNTLLVCDVEFVTSSSVRMVVFNKANNTKYLDEIVTSNLPFATSGMVMAIKAFGGASSGTLVNVDYIGAGITRPPFIVAPA